jgi:serine/threonine-protein kinase
LPLAESIADGSQVDWEAAEAHASDDEKAIIRQLRILSNLAVLHRSLPATAQGESPAITRRPQAGPAIGSWAHLALVERLGGGSFGEVYRAWDRQLEREVALKLMRDESVDDLEASRIAMEGRLLARIRHQNVITVHGVAVHDQRVGLWMELVRGATLEQLLQKRGPLSAREAALVGIDLCRALAAIHAAGLIHRDVKAQNVMREDGGRVVLMDLGTGREVDPEGRRPLSDLAGTPLYLAPEIFEGTAASERSDLYSLGVLLYHLVTGSFPARATTIEELRDVHAKSRGVRLRDARADLPTEFVRVVDRAIARDPGRRYASAGELEADLVRALDEQAPAVSTPAITEMPAADRAPRAWPGWVAWTVGTLAVAALILLAVPMIRSRIAPARPTLVAGRVKLAILPLQDLTAQSSVLQWPELIQALFVGELAGVQDVAVMDPLSMNALLANKLGAASPRRDPRLFDVLRQSSVSLVIDGQILRAGGGGYEIQINLVDPVTGETRFAAKTPVKVDEELTGVIRTIASGVLNSLQLQVLQLANDKDLRPWISGRRQNIQAVNAFLQASQHIFRYERVAAERYLRRAIELDPTFIEPRVWLIPGLVSQNKMPEARQHYDELLKLEAGASPFEQAMIAWVRARLDRDTAGQARQLELALDYQPGNNIILVNLAGARERLGDCPGALAAMQPAVDMHWAFPPMYELWGWCGIQAGRNADARQGMLTAISIRPVHPNVYGMLEALAIADGDAGGAARYESLYATRTRELDRPADPSYLLKVYARLGADCQSRARYDCAATLFSKAIAVAPKAPEYYDALAETFQKKGDLRRAEQQYRKALGIDPKWSHAYLMLGRISDTRHDSASAVRFYRAFVSLAQPGPDVDAVKQRLRELERR